MRKAVLDGLNSQECKQGSGYVKPPIPYIPENDERQEAVNASATTTIKLALLSKLDVHEVTRYLSHPCPPHYPFTGTSAYCGLV